MTEDMPNASGEIIDIRGLDKWSKNVVGCEKFLFSSAHKADPSIKPDMPGKWGSIIERTNLANEIFITSIQSGEESPSPNASGGTTNPPIGK